jgi:predicted XRE-type DNA-binding protein
MKKKIENEEKVEYTKGDNVFEDLGFRPDESARLRFKQELWLHIVDNIQQRELTQHQVSKILDVPQSRVSNVMNGKIQGMTIDSLMEFAAKLDQNVAFEIKRLA